MGLSSDTTRNLVIAASLAGALGIVAVRRLPRWIGTETRYSDGAEVYEDVRAEGVRHAVWDTPEDLGGEVNSAAHESRPAVSRDGRWLVFASAGEDSGWDLWIAELQDGVPQAARPLSGANSAADDLAPAFGEDGLYLASNRPGGPGGFDLWLAPFADGQAGAARLLADPLNTAFDELDPAPGFTPAGEPLLAFASDRGASAAAGPAAAPGGGLDLYVAWPERDGALRALDELNTPADEREPCLTRDGRSLFFATDSGGAFALARSFLDGERWLPARPLAGLDPASERRAPAIADDGFTLYFAAPRAQLGGQAPDPGDLYRARSLELTPLAPSDLGWKDLALVALLLLTALLAWLAKRWNELDVLYKCLLLSVLVHLLAMWLLREVRPETGPSKLGDDGGPTFRVQVLRDSSLASSTSERAGSLEGLRSETALFGAPERLQIEARPAEAESAPRAQVAQRASGLAQAPERQVSELERASEPASQAALDLRAPEESFERLARSAPAPALEAPRSLDPSQRSAAAAPAPELARSSLEPPSSSASAAALPTPAQVERPAGLEVAAPEFALRTGERTSSGSATAAPALAQLSERFEPLAAASAPEAGPQARAFDAGAASERAQPGAPDLQAGALVAGAPERSSAPAPSESSVARRAVELPDAPRARALEGLERAPASHSADDLALALPVEEFAPLGRSSPEVALATRLPEAASFAPQRSAATPHLAPARLVPEVEPRANESRAVEALAARPREDERRLPESPGPLFDTPYRTRFGSQKTTALREHGGGVDTEAAVARGLAYLASIQNQDGSWGDPRLRQAKYRQVAIGKTGLALLAFLGAGHTPAEGAYAQVADAAVRFLLASQSRASGHFGDSAAYGHGIATYALAECFALTHEERLRAPLERAIERILAAQYTRGEGRLVGGWSYYYRDGSTYDRWPRVSITAWQVMALESARLAGLAVPDASFELATEFLRNSWDPRLGAFRYSHDPERRGSGYPTLPGSTPAALFALSLLGEDLETAAYRPARSFVAERAPAGYRYRGDDAFIERAQGNLYFWYYGTLSSFRLGGRPWDLWNTALKETLLPAQEPDGSWRPLDIYATDYAADDDDDRSYTTALCVLSLEVYYRYFTPLLKVR